MAAMVDPYGARLDSPPDAKLDLACIQGAISLSSRVRTAVYRAKLMLALAEGADSGASRELTLRARQLTSERNRRSLARGLRWTIAEARQPTMTPGRVVIIPRAAALDPEASTVEMIDRLGSSDPVHVEGMALLEWILTRADVSGEFRLSARHA